MTRTDVVASSRPQKANVAPKRKAMRRLLVLPVALSLAVALVMPTGAFAATKTSKEGLSGYGGKPKTGTSPAKEKVAPKTSTAPETASTEPTTSTTPTAKSTLPFTGFDLSWTVGGGLLLVGMGFSIVTVQRRQRRETGR